MMGNGQLEVWESLRARGAARRPFERLLVVQEGWGSKRERTCKCSGLLGEQEHQGFWAWERDGEEECGASSACHVETSGVLGSE